MFNFSAGNLFYLTRFIILKFKIKLNIIYKGWSGHSNLNSKELFLVINSIGGHPWKLFIFNYYIKFIYFKVKEKLCQAKSLFFKVKDSNFGKKLPERLFHWSKSILFLALNFSK